MINRKGPYVGRAVGLRGSCTTIYCREKTGHRITLMSHVLARSPLAEQLSFHSFMSLPYISDAVGPFVASLGLRSPTSTNLASSSSSEANVYTLDSAFSHCYRVSRPFLVSRESTYNHSVLAINDVSEDISVRNDCCQTGSLMTGG